MRVYLRRVVAVIVGALVTGFALYFSMPPIKAGWLLPIAFVPVLWVLRNRSASEWAMAGFVVGTSAWGLLPHALVGWEASLQWGSWLTMGILFSIVFLATNLLSRRVSSKYQPLVLPTSWIIVSFLAESWPGVPMTVCCGWALTWPTVLGLSRIIGAIGVDWTLLFISTTITGMMTGGLNRVAGSIRLVFAIATIGLGTFAKTPAPVAKSRVFLVQPSITTKEYRIARWSLAKRNEIERKYDTLTEKAIANGPGLIIWPEGGNGLPNRRLLRRHELFSRILANTGAEMLVASNDLAPNNKRYNVISHITERGFGKDVRKRYTVPVAEAALDQGESTVLSTRFGRHGVAICYDSVFASHANVLARSGAQIIVAVTDDASFGISFLAEWHVALSVLRAIETGRPLIYLSNHGPALITDIAGQVERVDWSGSQPKVFDWNTKLVRAEYQTLSTLGGSRVFLATVVCLILFVIATSRRKQPVAVSKTEPVPWLAKTFYIGGVITAATATLAISLFVVVNERDINLHKTANEFRLRTDRKAAVDGLAPLFRQTFSNSCGAAAIAFILTMVGDDVFEEDIVRVIGDGGKSGHSFEQLIQAVESRGFSAVGTAENGIEELPPLGAPPVIAHLRIGHYVHYVVVIARDKKGVFFFDPAQGKTLYTSRSEFSAAWTGYLLVVRTREDLKISEVEKVRKISKYHHSPADKCEDVSDLSL
jgi:apolipoprotein N-acyltransferase/predicted double-glycine peptidase